MNSSHFTITIPHAVYESLSIVKRSSSTTLSTHTKLWILSASPISHYRIPPPGESSKDNIHEMSEGSAYHHTNTMTIDCRWMQVYEHTEWNQGSTGWLVGRIELITEDCRSEMNSVKITNITQTISNNLKSIHGLMILESDKISKMTGLKRKTSPLVLISGIQ